MKTPSSLVLVVLAGHALLTSSARAATVVNIDISRDNTDPLGGTADQLYVGTGAAADAGTIWNDYSTLLTGAGSTIAPGYAQTGLVDSNGIATTVGLTLNTGWFRTFNGTTGNNLQREHAFVDNGATGVATLTGLAPSGEYKLYFYAGGNLDTDYTVGATTKTATGAGFLQPINAPGFGEGVQFVTFESVFADEDGNLQFSIHANTVETTGDASLAGLQIVAVPEPSGGLLLLGSLVMLAIRRRR
jgi:hypothetical protein